MTAEVSCLSCNALAILSDLAMMSTLELTRARDITWGMCVMATDMFHDCPHPFLRI